MHLIRVTTSILPVVIDPVILRLCLKFLVVAITKRSYQIILSADIHADLVIQPDVRVLTLF
jgi:hypothetical protein